MNTSKIDSFNPVSVFCIDSHNFWIRATIIKSIPAPFAHLRNNTSLNHLMVYFLALMAVSPSSRTWIWCVSNTGASHKVFLIEASVLCRLLHSISQLCYPLLLSSSCAACLFPLCKLLTMIVFSKLCSLTINLSFENRSSSPRTNMDVIQDSSLSLRSQFLVTGLKCLKVSGAQWAVNFSSMASIVTVKGQNNEH